MTSCGCDFALHRELRLHAGPVSRDRCHREYAVSLSVPYRAVALLQASIDLDLIPLGGVPDVVDRQVVVLAPEERDVREGRSLSGDGPAHRLTLPLGEHPVFNPNLAAASGVWPARGVADREDALRRCLEIGVDHDPAVDSQPGLLGESQVRAHSDPGHDEIGGEAFTVLQHDVAAFQAACRLPEMEYDPVVFVEPLNEVADLGPEHALERPCPRRDDVHVDTPMTQ